MCTGRIERIRVFYVGAKFSITVSYIDILYNYGKGFISVNEEAGRSKTREFFSSQHPHKVHRISILQNSGEY